MYKQEDIRLIQALITTGNLKEVDFVFLDENTLDYRLKHGITRTLINHAQIEERTIAQVISKEFHIPLMESIEGETWIEVEGVTKDELQKYHAIPFFVERKELSVAFVDPPYQAIILYLENTTGKRIVPVVVTSSVFEELSLGGKAINEHQRPNLTKLLQLDAAVQEDVQSEFSVTFTPPDEIVQTAIETAYEMGADEIHFKFQKMGPVELSFRIAGVVQKATMLKPSCSSPLSAVLKQAGNVNASDNSDAPIFQGQAAFAALGKKIVTRLTLTESADSENIVLFLLTKNIQIRKVTELGLSGHDLARVTQLSSSPSALILFSGTARSGKTTTLYAFINQLRDGRRNISAVENPIEYQIDGITQISVDADRGLNFIESIRSLFKHRVDVLSVGEIKNKEEAALLIKAALAGIATVSTIQAPSAVSTLLLMQKLGTKKEELAKAISGIVAQRLVRHLCPDCRESYRPDRRLLEQAGLANLPERVLLSRGKGCKNCLNSGYNGTLALFETLPINDRIRELIMTGRSAADIIKAAEEGGFRSLRYDGLLKALAGLTTLEEIIRVAL
jgi:type IV pilus assembly protein PilB